MCTEISSVISNRVGLVTADITTDGTNVSGDVLLPYPRKLCEYLDHAPSLQPAT